PDNRPTRADARLWHRTAPEVADARDLRDQSRVSVPRAVRDGARRQGALRGTAKREQSASALLHAHPDRPQASRERGTALGTRDRRDRQRAARRMTILYRFRALVRWLFRRDEIERALDADLEDYIERSAAEKMRAGMS